MLLDYVFTKVGYEIRNIEEIDLKEMFSLTHQLKSFLFRRTSKCPEAPKGHKWKEVRHDNKVMLIFHGEKNVSI